MRVNLQSKKNSKFHRVNLLRNKNGNFARKFTWKKMLSKNQSSASKKQSLTPQTPPRGPTCPRALHPRRRRAACEPAAVCADAGLRDTPRPRLRARPAHAWAHRGRALRGRHSRAGSARRRPAAVTTRDLAGERATRGPRHERVRRGPERLSREVSAERGDVLAG